MVLLHMHMVMWNIDMYMCMLLCSTPAGQKLISISMCIRCFKCQGVHTNSPPFSNICTAFLKHTDVNSRTFYFLPCITIWICDYSFSRGCIKSYHPACVEKDDSFFESETHWTCGKQTTSLIYTYKNSNSAKEGKNSYLKLCNDINYRVYVH